MKLSKRRLLAVASLGMVGSLYLANASWLSSPGHGPLQVIAQRGVSQRYSSSMITDESCTARLILPPANQLIDNTLPSIEAAIAAGADVVELDAKITGDHQFVLFHDDELSCRTDGSGRVSEHSVAELQTLDVGYGYTADGGRTFPLRGKGVGLMPTLAEVLRKYPKQRFLVQMKDGKANVADSLVAYLGATAFETPGRLAFFGSDAPLRRLREMLPTVRTWSARSAARCLTGYFATGWLGRVPRVCNDGMIIVPVDQANLLWGWPNRFLARMHGHHTEVMLIGRIDSLATGKFSRLDTVEQLSRVPAGFDGSIWTDQIRVIGPAVQMMNAAVLPAEPGAASIGKSIVRVKPQ